MPSASNNFVRVANHIHHHASAKRWTQQLIAIPRRAIEQGRIHILTKVISLSQHLAVPCDGKLNSMTRYSNIWRCVSRKAKAEWFSMVSSWVQNLDEGEWWDLVQPLGNVVRLRAYVAANQAKNLKTRWSWIKHRLHGALKGRIQLRRRVSVRNTSLWGFIQKC